MRAKGVFVIGLPAHGALQKIEKATAARDVPWRSLDVPQSSNDGRGYRRRGCSNLTPSPDLARILETDRARPQHFVHRVARHLQLANDLLDRLPFDKCAPDPPNRLHNQHPPATHSCSPSGQPVQLIADGVKVGCRSPLYWGESSTPKHTQGGVADTIRIRCDFPDALCDPYLEPARNAFFRGLWRGRLRTLHAGGLLGVSSAWMDRFGLRPDEARELPMGKSFAVIWGELERISPRLARRPLTPRDLPGEIHTAKVMLQRLRRAPEWVPRGQGGIQPIVDE